MSRPFQCTVEKLLQVDLDLTDAQPVYRQIFTQVRSAIVSGLVDAGERLPPVRELSSRLHVSHLTVHRAYQLLAEENLVELRHGSGAYVAAIRQRELASAQMSKYLETGPLRGTLIHDEASLVTLLPDQTLYDPVPLFAEMLQLVSTDPSSMGFTAMEGDEKFITAVTDWMSTHNLSTGTGRVFVRSGSQIVSHLANSFLPRGSHVLVEQPTYVFAADWMVRQGIIPVGIPCNAGQIDLDFVSAARRNNDIKAVFVSPALGFGTGQNWRPDVTREFVSLVNTTDWTVIESYSRGPLSFTPPVLPLVKQGMTRPTITDFSLAEMISTGLQINWLVADNFNEEVYEQFLYRYVMPLKPLQLALARQFSDGTIDKVLQRATASYKQKASLFLNGFTSVANPDILVMAPQGGYSMAVQTPFVLPPSDLFQRTLEAKCPVMPGFFLGIRGSCQTIVRFNYGSLKGDECEELGQRVARVLNELIDENSDEKTN